MATPGRPFTTFNFKVRLELEGDSKMVCDASFAECDGIEMNLEAKTIKEGGNNVQPIHLPGVLSYGQLTLKRGMDSNDGLWSWFERTLGNRSLRASGEIAVLSSDRTREDVRFVITGCLPVKLKAPALNAKDGVVAIEEMQIAYETLSRESGEEEAA